MAARRTSSTPGTRPLGCPHYASPKDNISILFPCCNTFYPCHLCHAEAADHKASVLGVEAIDRPAVLCQRCQKTLTARAYLTCRNACPHCNAPFNPRCQGHYPLYFSQELLALASRTPLC